jgi:hypothetical protein
LRSLLNVVYVALVQSAEDPDELDRELEAWPADVGDRPATPANDGGMAALMAATRMPQAAG